VTVSLPGWAAASAAAHLPSPPARTDESPAESGSDRQERRTALPLGAARSLSPAKPEPGPGFSGSESAAQEEFLAAGPRVP
jgi:hypothetical protein